MIKHPGKYPKTPYIAPIKPSNSAQEQRSEGRDKEMLRSLDSINIRLNKLSGEVNTLRSGILTKEDMFFQDLIEKQTTVTIKFMNGYDLVSGTIVENFKFTFVLLLNKTNKMLVQKSSVQYMSI